MQKYSKYKIAANYAYAWFNAAKDKKIEEKVFDEVQLLKASYAHDKETWNILAAPIDDEHIKQSIIESIAKKIKLSEVSADALLVVVQNRRITLLALILNEFVKLYYQDKGIVEVTIETAVELSDAQDKKLRNVLEDKLNTKVLLKYLVNPEVLGGLKVSFDSFLIDDTLQTKLKRMKLLLSGGDVK